MSEPPAEPESEPSLPVAGDPETTDPIDTAWAHVLRNWDQDEAHAAFMACAVQLGRMPEVGRRYREVQATDPSRADEAARRIDKLVGLAMAKMQLTRTEPSQTPRRVLLAVAALLMIGSLMLAGWTVLRFQG